MTKMQEGFFDEVCDCIEAGRIYYIVGVKYVPTNIYKGLGGFFTNCGGFDCKVCYLKGNKEFDCKTYRDGFFKTKEEAMMYLAKMAYDITMKEVK